MMYAEMDSKTREQVEKQFSVWLRPYTHEVIKRVMARADEILGDDFAMHLLSELYEREQAEDADFLRSVHYLLSNYEDFAQYDPHSHCLEHSKSYRDVLYDLYIRGARA